MEMKTEKKENSFVWDGFEYTLIGEKEYWVKPVEKGLGRLVFTDWLRESPIGDSVIKSVENGIITVVSTRKIPVETTSGKVVYQEIEKTTFHVEGSPVEVGRMEYGNLDPYTISVIVSPEGTVHDACCITNEDLEWESPDFGTVRDSYYCGTIWELLPGELYVRWLNSK